MTYTQALAHLSRGRRVGRGDLVIFMRRGTAGSPHATLWRVVPGEDPVLWVAAPEDLAATDWRVV